MELLLQETEELPLDLGFFANAKCQHSIAAKRLPAPTQGITSPCFQARKNANQLLDKVILPSVSLPGLFIPFKAEF